MAIPPPTPLPSLNRIQQVASTILHSEKPVQQDCLLIQSSHISPIVRRAEQRDQFNRGIRAAESGSSHTEHTYTSYPTTEAAMIALNRAEYAGSIDPNFTATRSENRRSLHMSGVLTSAHNVKLQQHIALAPSHIDNRPLVLISEATFEPIPQPPSETSIREAINKAREDAKNAGKTPEEIDKAGAVAGQSFYRLV